MHPEHKPTGVGRFKLMLGGKSVTVYDGAVYTGVTLKDNTASMLVSHDMFKAMLKEMRNGKAASQKVKT